MIKKIVKPKIYLMKLHDVLSVGPCEIIRVPNGWVYTYGQSACFVPYDGEFDPNPGVREEIEEYDEIAF